MRTQDSPLLSGEDMRDDGVRVAAENADAACPSWSAMAYGHLQSYIRKVRFFLAEDARMYASALGLPEPPSKRAWGSVILKAAREGLIARIGYQPVKNKAAHCTPASLWEVAR